MAKYLVLSGNGYVTIAQINSEEEERKGKKWAEETSSIESCVVKNETEIKTISIGDGDSRFDSVQEMIDTLTDDCSVYENL